MTAERSEQRERSLGISDSFVGLGAAQRAWTSGAGTGSATREALRLCFSGVEVKKSL
jgi:hypothetical protein